MTAEIIPFRPSRRRRVDYARRLAILAEATPIAPMLPPPDVLTPWLQLWNDYWSIWL